MRSVTMTRMWALVIRLATRDCAQSRVREAAKHLLAQANVIDEEKSLAIQALEVLTR